MKISQYTIEYTENRKPITFYYVWLEIKEFFVEIVKFNWGGIKEEFEDVLHFLQLWLYARFGVDGELWGITKHSVKKFMDRKIVWNRIYVFVGLSENISGYVGNYRKVEKVIKHLNKFKIEKEKAELAYKEIVPGILKN